MFEFELMYHCRTSCQISRVKISSLQNIRNIGPVKIRPIETKFTYDRMHINFTSLWISGKSANILPIVRRQKLRSPENSFSTAASNSCWPSNPCVVDTPVILTH